MIPILPYATYRLQFNSTFTFNDARKIIPYLHDLGISHCYASPLLKARSGSSHGYDIVDHNALNPELGTPEEFHLFVETLHAHDMGLILDIVPNHMGIGGSDNSWWLDILENGPASPYADYFDINWYPQAARIFSGKLLLPILGDYYGNVLDRGEIELTLSEEQEGFVARYYEHLLPIDPKTYGQILGPAATYLKELQSGRADLLARMEQLGADCQHLPSRNAASRRLLALRQNQQAACKRELRFICQEQEGQKAIRHSLALFNDKGKGRVLYKLLHRLLEKQAYRLAFWKVAADDINYRRFFNINSLAGLRQEKREVFEATHRFVFTLIEQGLIQGLRIDHPDGLFDPQGYYDRLSRTIRRLLDRDGVEGGRERSFYLVAEKILAIHEDLPHDWPIHGTTGYDFATLLNGLFIQAEGEKPLTQAYHFCTGQNSSYDEKLHGAKRLIIKAQLGSELTVLANMLRQIAEQDRHTRDFTLPGLREALSEVVACFPVYRTYVTPATVADKDRHHVEWAVAEAKQRNPVTDPAVFDFVRDSLLLTRTFGNRRNMQNKVTRFAMKFQQYTSPVMAKAQEDTVFYRDYRLISLNEVGGDPRRFSVSRTTFHQVNKVRQENWPYAMLATSTHDSKRSEDVRARINVLSEIPTLWKKRVKRWQRLNRRHTRQVNGATAPSRNDEYLLYQTLVGTFPIPGPTTEQELGRYQERMAAYMLKAVREAKVHTSWLNPDPCYETAVASFVESLLNPGSANRFLADFSCFAQSISRLGLLNSLSQLLLKLTAPGVPDIYQGNELWDFSLVDPDNRRPVDFSRPRKMLLELADLCCEETPPGPALAALFASLEDGRAKLLVTNRILRLRNKHPALFSKGTYEVLPILGPAEHHLCVITRSWEGEQLLAIAPRFFSTLLGDQNWQTKSSAVMAWDSTRICLPPSSAPRTYRDIFSGEIHAPIRRDNHDVLMAAALLDNFPVALLYSPAPP
jgi:(1->4)-alpha-D-glucan 1-alpha-D-glucosylmutase